MEINREEISISTIQGLIGFASRCRLQQNQNRTHILSLIRNPRRRRVNISKPLSHNVVMISEGAQILSSNPPMTELAKCNLFQHLKTLSILGIQDDYINTF